MITASIYNSRLGRLKSSQRRLTTLNSLTLSEYKGKFVVKICFSPYTSGFRPITKLSEPPSPRQKSGLYQDYQKKGREETAGIRSLTTDLK